MKAGSSSEARTPNCWRRAACTPTCTTPSSRARSPRSAQQRIAETTEFFAGQLVYLGGVLLAERGPGRPARAAARLRRASHVADLGRRHRGAGKPRELAQGLLGPAQQVLVSDRLQLAGRQAMVQPRRQADRPA